MKRIKQVLVCLAFVFLLLGAFGSAVKPVRAQASVQSPEIETLKAELKSYVPTTATAGVPTSIQVTFEITAPDGDPENQAGATVTFYAGAHEIGDATTDASGMASIAYTFPSPVHEYLYFVITGSWDDSGGSGNGAKDILPLTTTSGEINVVPAAADLGNTPASVNQPPVAPPSNAQPPASEGPDRIESLSWEAMQELLIHHLWEVGLGGTIAVLATAVGIIWKVVRSSQESSERMKDEELTKQDKIDRQDILKSHQERDKQREEDEYLQKLAALQLKGIPLDHDQRQYTDRLWRQDRQKDAQRNEAFFKYFQDPQNVRDKTVKEIRERQSKGMWLKPEDKGTLQAAEWAEKHPRMSVLPQELPERAPDLPKKPFHYLQDR